MASEQEVFPGGQALSADDRDAGAQATKVPEDLAIEEAFNMYGFSSDIEAAFSQYDRLRTPTPSKMATIPSPVCIGSGIEQHRVDVTQNVPTGETIFRVATDIPPRARAKDQEEEEEEEERESSEGRTTEEGAALTIGVSLEQEEETKKGGGGEKEEEKEREEEREEREREEEERESSEGRTTEEGAALTVELLFLDIQEQWRRSIVEYLASLPTASCLVQELGYSVPKPQGVGKNYSVAEVIRRDEMGRFELTGQGPTMSVELKAGPSLSARMAAFAGSAVTPLTSPSRTLSSEQSAATASAPSSVLDIQEQWRSSIVKYLALANVSKAEIPHSTEDQVALLGAQVAGEARKDGSAKMSDDDLYRTRLVDKLRQNARCASTISELGTVPPPGGTRKKGALMQFLKANPNYFELRKIGSGEFLVKLVDRAKKKSAAAAQSEKKTLQIKPDDVNKTTLGDGNKDGSLGGGYVLVDTAKKMTKLLLSDPTFLGHPDSRPEITSPEHALDCLQLDPELTDETGGIPELTGSIPVPSRAPSVDPRSIVSVDCEFMQKRVDPDSATTAWNPTVVVDELSLIQVATLNGTYIFDCVALPAKDVCDFLRPLLSSKLHIKLFHDIHKDAHCLHAHGGIDSMVHLLDTQLAAEHLWGGMLCGLSEFLGKLNLPEHPSKQAMKRQQTSSPPDYWMKRPLDEFRMEYAAHDVMLLLKAGPLLFEKLGGDLDAVISASEKRAQASIRGDFGRSICFDPSRNYALASQELLSSTNREVYEIQPMKVECEAHDLINLLPADLRTKFDVSDDDDGDSPSSRHHGQTMGADWRPPSMNLVQAGKDQDSYADALESEISPKSRLKSPPSRIIGRSSNSIPKSGLRDVVLDIGRRPLCYDVSCCRHMLSDSEDRVVTRGDIEHVTSKIGGFGSDKRAALDGKLHRISALHHREGQVVGLTMRCGRYVQGNADMIMDLLLGTDKNILFLGEPGSGKTTIVREAARILAERKAVMLVDTSNEIAGDGNVPHPCIGDARRMMVPSLEDQHRVMIECVQNHTPQIMIVDEIGRPKEVAAVRTVKQRGVRVVGSAHGSLESLISNSELNGLVGGKTTVTIGDATAKELQRSGKSAGKLQTKRAGEATFEVIVEVKRGSHNQWRVIVDSEDAVDSILGGRQYKAQVRTRDPATGRVSMELIQVQRAGSTSVKASN